jgi:uncharacterized protein (DUF885 family)
MDVRVSYRALLALSLFTASCFAADALPEPARSMHALFDESWERDLREDPRAATYLGEHRYDRVWPDMTPAAIAKREAGDVAALERLHGIDRARLSPAEQLNYDLFERVYQDRIELQPFKEYLYSVLSRDGLHNLSETAELLPFTTVADYENWIARLRSLDRYIDQNIALLQTAIREKRTQPRAVLERVVEPLGQLASSSVEGNSFYAPFKRVPATIPPPERARLIDEGRAAVEQVVIPAYRKLNDFFTKQYLPAGRSTVGIWDTPGGDAFYRERVAFHTTTKLTPAEIHAIGLKEVARIRGEMDSIIAQLSFKGSFEEFLTFLRTDPQFYYKSPDDLFEAYAATAKRIDPELVKLFGRLPRMPYGVREIPMTSAPNTTTAYYQGPGIDGTRAGYYYVNLYRPEVRPKYEIEVLTVHEAVPGHHLQIALGQELEDLPQFRRNAGFTAFVEGWGLYSESLGDELGLYKDPYSKFGQLTYEMWRAVRLVVDTGMHYKHWTRQQAIDYFKSNAAKTEADIVNEVDRYIAWPGQALAYKIGQLKIMDLRRQAQAQLGTRFDIRAFHDTVLGSGAVPLDVLERLVQSWVVNARSSTQGHSPAASSNLVSPFIVPLASNRLSASSIAPDGSRSSTVEHRVP